MRPNELQKIMNELLLLQKFSVRWYWYIKKLNEKKQKKSRKPVFRLFRRNDRTTHDKTNYKHNKFNFIHKNVKKIHEHQQCEQKKRFFVVQYLASRRVCFSYFIFSIFCIAWEFATYEAVNEKTENFFLHLHLVCDIFGLILPDTAHISISKRLQ